MKKLNFERNINEQIGKAGEFGLDLKHNFEKKSGKPWLWGLGLVVVVLGIASGYFLSLGGRFAPEEIKRELSEEEIQPGVIVGLADDESFPDSAEGTLEEGGIDGEGTHHLVRGDDESQHVYLTSSVITLDKYTGHEVKVWGETFAAQQAGWLMDVGKLKVID